MVRPFLSLLVFFFFFSLLKRRGNWSRVVRGVPYAAIQYASFERYNRFFRGRFRGAHFVAGSLAGATAVCLTHPLDVVRGRLAVQRGGDFRMVPALRNLFFRREQWAGLRASLLGIVPFAGAKFLAFEEQKALWYRLAPDRELPSPVRLAMGALSGAAGLTVAYPLDVVRRRAQVAGLPGVEMQKKDYGGGVAKALASVWRKEGVRGLYRGIAADYAKVAPMVGISLTVFDWVQSATGVKLSRKE